jgi:hypothetical protein
MTRKIYPLRFVVVLTLAVYSVSSFLFSSFPAQAANVVQNSGFETAGTGGAGDAANWTEGANHARASDKFNTGAWSLKSTYRGAGTDTRQTVTITTNTTYTYSGYIWRTNSVGGACLDMNDIVGELTLCVTTAGSWQFVSGTWNSGPNTSVTLRLITDASPTGDMWFDNLSLDSGAGPTNTSTNTPVPPTNTPTNTPVGPTNTPTNTPASVNVVQNPGFETSGGSANDAANWTEGVNHTRASDKFNTGAWSLKSTYRGAGTDTRQTVSITANTAYTYSGYVWRTNTVGNACLDMNDIIGEVQQCVATAGSWQFISANWNSGSNTSVTLRLITDGSPTGNIWFDTISLSGAGPTNTPTNTPVPPSNTPTRTPTPSNSPTRTNTPIVPTNTPTRTATPIGPVNVVLNPSFETAGGGGAADAANWIEGVNHARANDKFNTGSWSLKSTYRSLGTDTRQTLLVAPNANYTYSGYIWWTTAVGGACMDMNDILNEVTLCASATGSWQFVSGTWNSGAFNSVTLRLITDGSPTGDIWFDDIALTGPPAPTPTPTNTPTRTRTPTPGPSPTPLSNMGVLGNTFVGYQGWFDAAGSGSPINRWNHWAPGVAPAPGNIKFELYPDTREYTSLFQTGLGNLGNGSPAKLFSSYTNQTINLHFSWMQTNNIDGVGLQRFGNELTDPGLKAFRDDITIQVKDAAEDHSRLFYIMYDVSGMGSTFVGEIESDWTNTIMGTMNLTASRMYARQNGQPVVSLWGVGFQDRPGSATDWTDLITWFQNQGVYVIGGTPRDWRTETGDSKPGFLSVYSSLDMISPWTVGMATLTNDPAVDDWMNTYVIPDRDYTAAHGMDYQPVIFPGFAWSNWNGGVRNQLPRRAGGLLWRMAYDVKLANISTAYIAMFDEYDEGTAIAKAAEDSSMIPNNQYFLTLDADGIHVSSDFYLRLAGAANQLLKGQIPLLPNIPIPYQ